MGILSGTKVYLSGPAEHAEDASSWRNDVTDFLWSLEIQVYDPLIKPDWLPPITKIKPSDYIDNILGGSSDHFDAVVLLRKLCLKYACDAEWAIVYMPKQFTVGTIEEFTKIVEMNKPILVVSEDFIPSSWALSMMSTFKNYRECFFHNFEELKERILKIDNNEITLDPIKWSFITYFRTDVKIHNPLA